MNLLKAIPLHSLLLLTSTLLFADEKKQHSSYTLPNSWKQADQRLEAYEETLNPNTFKTLTRLGIQKGWHCLDVGSGKGSVAEWMLPKVGPDGSVTATDINTELLSKIRKSGLVVLEHDIVNNTLPPNQFDLIHVRNVLMHLPGKQQIIINKLFSALKPRGILVVDDMGIIDARHRLSTLNAPEAVWKKEGADYGYLEEKQLIDFHSTYLNHKRFKQAGFIGVEAELTGKLAQGGDTSEGRYMYLSTLQLEPYQNQTIEDKAQFEGILNAYKSPESRWWNHFQVITWGMKPSAKLSGQ